MSTVPTTPCVFSETHPNTNAGGRQLCFGKDLVNRRDQWETPILAPPSVRGGLGEAGLVLDDQCLKNQEVLLSGYHVAAERASFVLKYLLLFICQGRVLVVAMGSSSPTRDQTQGPTIESSES